MSTDWSHVISDQFVDINKLVDLRIISEENKSLKKPDTLERA